MRWLVGLLAVTFLLAGCGSKPEANLSAEEEAARNVAVQYLQGLAHRDEHVVTMLSDRWRQQVGDAALLVAIREPHVSQFDVGAVLKDDTHPHPAGTTQFRVTLQVTPDAGNTAWVKGENTRYVVLVPDGGTYRVDALAS